MKVEDKHRYQISKDKINEGKWDKKIDTNK